MPLIVCDRLDETGHDDGREPLERLVEEQDGRPQRHGPRDGDHLLLATAEVEATALEKGAYLRKDREYPLAVRAPGSRAAAVSEAVIWKFSWTVRSGKIPQSSGA